jgi:hypothetical protein
VPDKLIIDGDMVRVERVETISEARLVDLLPHIESRPPITVGLLPKSAIFFFWDESNPMARRAAFLCEMTPGVRTANYNNHPYAISLPWTYFLFDFSTKGNPADGSTVWSHTNSRVFWAREQVTSVDSLIGRALVPNCDQEGAICYGTTAVDATLPLGVRVDRLVDEFYRSAFTHDSGTGSPFVKSGIIDGREGDWTEWVKQTAMNPHVWQDFHEWTKNRGTPAIHLRPLRDVLGSRHDRMKPITLEGTIPPLIEPMTFGRAEEWLAGISEASVTRLKAAIEAREAATPATRVTTRTRVTPVGV